MQAVILDETRFNPPSAGWSLPPSGHPDYQATPEGIILSATDKRSASLNGLGVHTRNGDSIELHFRLLECDKGVLRFGFSGGFESAIVTLDFTKKLLSLSTTDWTRPQPARAVPLEMARQDSHALVIEKTEGNGRLVKNANIIVFLDGEKVLFEPDLNLLPEMGVTLEASRTHLLVERFTHRGISSGMPEYLHVGGWQMPNKDSIEDNLKSIFRGLEESAEKGVQLLVTPETSLTGLFPASRVRPVAKNHAEVTEAEGRLQNFVRKLKNAPYLVVGLPVWTNVPGHRRQQTRYNASRVYDPDGNIVSTHAKIHSCEYEFWHGYRLQEFEVYGVPVGMHICHDSRYPAVWTLPVMFGARLILHPSNGIGAKESIDAFEARAKTATTTSHAFYVYANGEGRSYIAGPQRNNNLIAVSSECRRDIPSFPMIGDHGECLVHANIRIHDAFGYWPVRSYRTSEATAAAYVALYESMGGQRLE